MNADELGLLALRIHDDRVTPMELRKFILVMMHDEAARANASLAGSLSPLQQSVREDYYKAHVLTLLTSPTLKPPGEGVFEGAREFTGAFFQHFSSVLRGPWSTHVYLGPDDIRCDTPKAYALIAKPNTPGNVSALLGSHLQALGDFWGVRGLYVK